MIETLFAHYFQAWGLRLPPDAIASRSPGEVEGAGWHVRWVVAPDGSHLDMLASHRMTNTRHVRLRADGEMEDLPCYHELVIWNEEEGETREEAAAANQAHNRRIGEMRRAKGLAG